MSVLITGAEDFLSSVQTSETPLTPDPEAFLRERAAASSFSVEQVPLGSLADWRLDDRISHSSGRFFTVEGLSVQTNFGPTPQWCQPIIVQPDIGVLGILVKRIHGVYHFLMQAKMEPGNSALVQYSATVQATPSNYQRVHGGKSTPYLDYFLNPGTRVVIFDQLLSEHSSWYLYKRNRNMIVEIPAHEEVPIAAEFTWLTLGQLRRLLARGNRVNMNARTVLASIAYALPGTPRGGGRESTEFHAAVVRSHQRQTGDGDVASAMTWLIDQKARFNLDVRRISLREMAGWICDEESIRHREGHYFRIVGLSVGATSREVAAWAQPMLRPNPGNVVTFVCRRRQDTLEFLVQAMAQPGATDRVELAATVQLTPGNYNGPQDLPPLAELLHCDPSWVVVDAVQSEDGGRFQHADTRHLVIQLPEHHPIEAPDNYRWMSLGLLNRLMRLGYYVNVETRSLMACLL
ncbi:NDP-hexose 2,3-dehydratase family protein [Streptacidiphilus sp. P02-A3a]|uniref:NDP-hexose 2,3-dehydratase family protein n=1 Tax=Streptacidiphilus sp. P02-A3a TaxID=2704468 RepID=UPI0015FA27B2|nr:NDP-hexose 2,3-dehydratase family protein [Streptacidiphilus sp. P02-A3a]QMU70545.1 NDP-hexose 2,3-dehydratase [Streptacidiphilus sp. P02-A3a]